MKGDDFVDVQPWYTSRLNAPPAYLDSNDYRQKMFENATTNLDFTLETLDGTIETVRYLLYLTVDGIRTFVNEHPDAYRMKIDYRRDTVEEMINFALKGTFGLIEAPSAALNDYIACIRLYRPHGFWQLIRYIASKLSEHVTQFELSFRRDYNADSTGERLEIYKELKHSTTATEGNVLQKMQSIHYSSRNIRRILRYSETALDGCVF
ncbi:unnamed protein product [Anisakis simplex]|uniref:Virion structural protein n=1 Tax=Anisakis simplex TaxID=6269 RepID=A0A0M3K7Y7_ANISI|nr:unnamed protein product [Anisakis simplex]